MLFPATEQVMSNGRSEDGRIDMNSELRVEKLARRRLKTALVVPQRTTSSRAAARKVCRWLDIMVCNAGRDAGRVVLPGPHCV